jgi:predicted acylesterase/phospholipase RssA
MTGLVLCRGGSKGAVEVWLYRALVELGIPIGLVVRTSVGAINGAAVAAGLSPDALARLFSDQQRGSDAMADRVQVTLQVEGMTCDGCARHIESALRGVAWVREITVPTWQAGSTTVIADTGVTDDPLDIMTSASKG